MIPGHCVLYLVGVGGATGAALLFSREPRLRRRSIDEVADFILDPDQDKLLRSFDPEQDGFWRRQRDRRIQRTRLELFRDCLTLTIRNVLVLYEWGLSEWFSNKQHELGYSPELVQAIERLIDTCKRYLKVSRSIRRRLHLSARSRFEIASIMPVPQLAEFQTFKGIDLVDAYKAVGIAGVALAQAHGNVEPIIKQIRLCFWMA